ncbi:MAG TPA: DUF433 domain-containing protein [Polyangia bacterium]|nr:DUF433 domain-containing protein [Polyangia bacterium]
MAAPKIDIYGGRDPRDVSAYTIPEAAGFLRLPESTLRKWVRGQAYATKGGGHRSRPVIHVPASRPWTLSFWNLAEAHVLAAITRQHGVALQSVRKALDYVARELDIERPLITQDFHTDGINLFVERLEKMVDEDPGVKALVNASQHGQLAARDLLVGALKRVSRDTNGLIERIYPWIKTLDEPRRIEIDPRRAFGRPVVTGTRVPADELAERFAAGDGVEEIAREFRMDRSLVEGVLQWEMARTQDAAAA